MTANLIIGGGPAGASLAIRMAQAGREVLLLERGTQAVDKICGEFISPEAADDLSALGFDLPQFGAVRISRIRLCCGNTISEAELPFRAWSLSRRVLDEALLGRAGVCGVKIQRGAKAVSLARVNGGWRATLLGGARVEAKNVFLATGKHDLHGHRRPPGFHNDLIAFKQHWRLAPSQLAAIKNHVELFLFAGGYAGLQAIEAGYANLCLVVRRSRLRSVGNHWHGLLEAMCSESCHLRQRLTGAAPLSSHPLALSAIPYGHVRRQTDGLWRLGDQAAVIPSFAGEGIAIALRSGKLVADAFLRGDPVESYQRHLAGEVSKQVMFATALSHGLVRSRSQHLLSTLAHRWPELISMVASRTRLSERAGILKKTRGTLKRIIGSVKV